jgi:hypothetical protein
MKVVALCPELRPTIVARSSLGLAHIYLQKRFLSLLSNLGPRLGRSTPCTACRARGELRMHPRGHPGARDLVTTIVL